MTRWCSAQFAAVPQPSPDFRLDMQIQVNGESRTIESGSTITGLLSHLEIQVDRVAVEVNLHIVDRPSFDRRILQEGDRVEIISFIGGGVGEWVDEDDLRCSAPRTRRRCSVDVRS